MPKVYKILGPPGTGKTEYLLRQVERACNRYFPKEIGVVSYTVASVKEAKQRIQDKLQVESKDIKNVRTIHSHCFSLLGLKKENVMETAKNIRAFNEEYPAYRLGLGLLKRDDDDQEEENKETERNDKIFDQIQVLRSRMMPLSTWPSECKELYQKYYSFMLENEKVDFNGMLEQCVDRHLSPDIKVLMVDEAQDLPALQMALIKQWGESCDTVLYAGDGNQAIYRFAGSDPNNFINLEAEKVIPLEQSYRLSPAVLAKSVEVIKQANIKEIVNFKPTDEYGPGQVLHTNAPDFSLPGTHMILCRCNYQVRKVVDALRRHKLVFCNPYRPEEKAWNPMEQDGAKSIRAYLKYQRGEELNIYEIRQITKNCVAKECLKRGAKGKIKDLPTNYKTTYEFFGLLAMGFLDKFLDKQKSVRDYFRIKTENADLLYDLADNDPGQFFEQPRIIVGTVHSVKGGSARNIWINPSITHKIKKAMSVDPNAWDDEARIAYVAVSRAESTVGILPARGYRTPFLE